MPAGRRFSSRLLDSRIEGEAYRGTTLVPTCSRRLRPRLTKAGRLAQIIPMKTMLTLLISTMLLLPGWSADRAPAKNWQVYFSPHGGCTEAVVGDPRGGIRWILPDKARYWAARK